MPDPDNAPWWQLVDGGVHIFVRATPRARRTEIVGVRDELLHVKVHAPPVDGAANAAVAKLLAAGLGTAPSNVTLVRGERARVKTFRVAGIDDPSSLVGELPFPVASR